MKKFFRSVSSKVLTAMTIAAVACGSVTITSQASEVDKIKVSSDSTIEYSILENGKMPLFVTDISIKAVEMDKDTFFYKTFENATNGVYKDSFMFSLKTVPDYSTFYKQGTIKLDLNKDFMEYDNLTLTYVNGDGKVETISDEDKDYTTATFTIESTDNNLFILNKGAYREPVYVNGYYPMILRNSDGSLNLSAFWQLNPDLQVFTYGAEYGLETGMSYAGCNISSTAYTISSMGYNVSPLDLYYSCEAPYGSLTYCHVAELLGPGAYFENDVWSLNRYLEDSLREPEKYSYPVICCSAYNGWGTHYLCVVDFVRDSYGNVIDYRVMDPAYGEIINLSESDLPHDWDGLPYIIGAIRYVKP